MSEHVDITFLIYFTCELFGSHLIEYDCKSLSIISDVTLPRRSSKNEKNVLKNRLPKILDMLNRKRQGNIMNFHEFITLFVN